MSDLLDSGNSVVVVDHDVQVLREADWMIELGPGSGADGGTILVQGTIEEVASGPVSLIGPFLTGREDMAPRVRPPLDGVSDRGALRLVTSPLHTVHALDVTIPKGRLTAVTGMSGSGKTTLVLDSLVPALRAGAENSPLPDHVVSLDAAGVSRVDVVDATPIGVNVRSTVATYSGILDELRRAYAASDTARRAD